MGSWDTHFTSCGVKNPVLAHRVVPLDHRGGLVGGGRGCAALVTSLLTISAISAWRSLAVGEGEVSDVWILWALGSGQLRATCPRCPQL